MMKNVKRNTFIAVVMSFLLVFGLTPIHANEKSTIQTVDALKEAIANADDGTILQLDTAFVSSDVDIVLNGKTVTIDGNHVVWDTGGITISGNGSLTITDLDMEGSAIPNRLITNKLTSGTLTLQGLTLQNATQGALNIDTQADAKTEIVDTHIFNNTAGSGPAMYLGTNSNVLISYSTIENNSGTAGGYEAGAIASKGYNANLQIQNTIFRNNINKAAFTGVFGGGGGAMSLHYLTGNVSIDQSYFIGNETNGTGITPQKTFDGGAIYVFDGRDGAEFTISNSTFAYNIAYDDGGAIMFQGTGNPGLTTTISNSTFYENKAYGLDGAGYSGGAIQYFKNGGSSRMTNTIHASTFVGNQGGDENSSLEQRGGAIGLSGAGTFATATVSRNNSLFLGNRVYNNDGVLNHSSNYKDISNNQTTQKGTDNIINVDKGVDSTQLLQDILGINGSLLVPNQTEITAGVERSAVPTVPYKPEGMADNTYTGKGELLLNDQRLNDRYKAHGAVQASWIKYDANGGAFGLMTMDSFDGTAYYEADDSSVVSSYYKLGFIHKLGSIIDDESVNLSREGYTFRGWSTDENATEADVIYDPFNEIIYPQQGVTLYAVWDEVVPIESYTVTYTDGVAEAEIFEDQSYTVDAGTTTPAYQGTFEREGYTFTGWSPLPEDTVTQDQVYTAQWAINKYTISYEANGGTPVNEETVSYMDVFKEPVNPTLSGYMFEGWYRDEALTQRYNFTTPAISDVHLYAQWIAKEEPITVYTIIYEDGSADASIFERQQFKAAMGDPMPQFVGTPIREGYTFIGWDPVQTETVQGNVTYRAQWKADVLPIDPTDPVNPSEPPKPESPHESEDALPSTGVANNPIGLVLMMSGLALCGVAILIWFKSKHER